MSVVEMRETLHQAVDRENSEDFLLLLKNMIDQKNTPYQPIAITPDQVKELEVSYGQYQTQDVMPIEPTNNITEVKESLHHAIDRENDQDFLHLIQNILDQKSAPHAPLSITPAQANELAAACHQYQAKDVMTIEAANQVSDQWLARLS